MLYLTGVTFALCICCSFDDGLVAGIFVSALDTLLALTM